VIAREGDLVDAIRHLVKQVPPQSRIWVLIVLIGCIVMLLGWLYILITEDRDG
jgi:uncharacterized membrane protein YgdD (TMEM256/DUF423 family)